MYIRATLLQHAHIKLLKNLWMTYIPIQISDNVLLKNIRYSLLILLMTILKFGRLSFTKTLSEPNQSMTCIYTCIAIIYVHKRQTLNCPIVFQLANGKIMIIPPFCPMWNIAT